ncbi:MAG: ABC-type transport auxiliary lipoprotein family protein [Phenylobacterium sp.]
MQLYRFGPTATVSPSTASLHPVGVRLANGSFAAAAGGDGILTVTGERTAFIAGARWAAPASLLFNQAVADAFDAAPGVVRLDARGQQTPSAYVLRLDVRNFEARYDAGRNGPPVVVLRMRAALAKADLSTTVDQVFETRASAGGDRVGAIVAAYDRALTDLLGDLVAWTARNVS